MQQLTHLDAQGNARMVDVGNKPETSRLAIARGYVRTTPETARMIAGGDLPKGDVLTVARLAGIQAAKKTWDLIPLAHPIALSHVNVDISVDAEEGRVEIIAEAGITAKTGVEMEALTACSVAALTIYDMVKGVERGVSIERVELIEKRGGKSDWRRDDG